MGRPGCQRLQTAPLPAGLAKNLKIKKINDTTALLFPPGLQESDFHLYDSPERSRLSSYDKGTKSKRNKIITCW